jgi:hypothetical protein
MFEVSVVNRAVADGKSVEYESLKLPYKLDFIYTPDFILSNNIIIECKGFLDQQDRRKLKAVKDQHPELDIRLVFQKASRKLTKAKSSSTYAQWAEKYGFKWSEDVIPLEWYDE